VEEITSEGLKELKKLLNSELGAYGINYELEEVEDNYWTVSIKDKLRKLDKSLNFKYEENEVYLLFSEGKTKIEQLFLDMGDGSWEPICWVEPTIKYFWMVLLWG